MKNIGIALLPLLVILILATGNAQEKTVASEKETLGLTLKKNMDALQNLNTEGTLTFFQIMKLIWKWMHLMHLLPRPIM